MNVFTAPGAACFKVIVVAIVVAIAVAIVVLMLF
jgi:hypothetical protein